MTVYPTLFFVIVSILFIEGITEECNGYNSDPECHDVVESFSDDPGGSGEVPGAYVLGGIVSDKEISSIFNEEITKINLDGSSVSPLMTLYGQTLLVSDSAIKTARDLCNHVIAKEAFSVIIGGYPTSVESVTATSYTVGYYDIPVISTSMRLNLFTNKVVFIHNADAEGLATLRAFMRAIKDVDDTKSIKISSTIEIPSDVDSLVEKFFLMKDSPVNVYLLSSSSYECSSVLKAARTAQLFTKSFVWLVSEACLSEKLSLPVGILSVKLRGEMDQRSHLSDAIKVVSRGIRDLLESGSHEVTAPPSNCKDNSYWNVTGPNLYSSIKSQKLTDGKTGYLSFDDNGDRQQANYDIINTKSHSQIHIVGSFDYSEISNEMSLNLNQSAIMWPGGTSTKPPGYTIPSHLKVLSMHDRPFVYLDEEEYDESHCSGMEHSKCWIYDKDIINSTTRCCYGYCVRLLNELARSSNFTYDLLLSRDQEYGQQHYDNGSFWWSGLIGDLLLKRHAADMIMAPLTINTERNNVIDFSKPFKYQGIGILVKYTPIKTSNVSIVRPFSENLWGILLVSVHIIALIVWLLDRYSPMYKRENSESDSLILSEACWLSWGVMLNSGMNEGTPRSLSARVLTMIWAGFAMILLASYTANLAAFLVLEEQNEILTGINDPKLRNPSENYTFATVVGSAVDTYFRQKIELSNMYRVMNRSNVMTAVEGVNAVLNGSLKAFIWDNTRLEFESSRNCRLITVGDIFGRSGYGIGLTRNSPWTDKITLDILQFHESGLMSDLDNEWIWNYEAVECPPDPPDGPLKLGLVNLEGIFIMVVGGISSGIVLVLVEIVYDRHFKPKVIQKIQGSLRQPEATVITTDNAENTPQFDQLDTRNRLPISFGGRNLVTEERPEESQTNKRNVSSFEEEQDEAMKKVAERLKESSNIPNSYKSATDHQWAELYLQRVREKIVQLEAASDHDDDDEILKLMRNTEHSLMRISKRLQNN